MLAQIRLRLKHGFIQHQQTSHKSSLVIMPIQLLDLVLVIVEQTKHLLLTLLVMRQI